MEKLKLRLEILKNSNVIDEDVYIKLKDLIYRLKDKWMIELTEENGSMIITHIAIALQRIKKGDFVNEIDEKVYEEVLKSDKLMEIEEIYDDIENNIFKEKIPNEEKKYIYINLLLLKENLI